LVRWPCSLIFSSRAPDRRRCANECWRIHRPRRSLRRRAGANDLVNAITMNARPTIRSVTSPCCARNCSPVLVAGFITVHVSHLVVVTLVLLGTRLADRGRKRRGGPATGRRLVCLFRWQYFRCRGVVVSRRRLWRRHQFHFADLITLPLLLIYRRFYGTSSTRRLFFLLWLVMSGGGLLIDLLFSRRCTCWRTIVTPRP